MTSPLRKTKIVCTIGPATADESVIARMLRAGMNVARFNFSHGTHAYHRENIHRVRNASLETGIPVALLLDTKGPEIRTGAVADGKPVVLMQGRPVTLTTREVAGTDECLSVSYLNLPSEVSGGKHIYIADGLVDLVVESVEGEDIKCRVVSGGEIGARKNVNVVGVKTSLPAITPKDEEDILFAIEEGLEFIAASFIRKPSDVQQIRAILEAHGSPIRIIAKIEDEEGLENIDEIIRISDGIMIARGDLGVQLATERIPLVQKRIIEKCNRWYKPVITATQMLDSMIVNPRPTRAELTDVANAVFDGTDAVMLSGETANGKYPVEAVETMAKIALTVEQSPEYVERGARYFDLHSPVREKASSSDVSIHPSGEADIANSVARAAYIISKDIDAEAFLAPTLRGNTARLLSAYRPAHPVIAVTPSETVLRQLLLSWGVYPILTELANNSDIMIQNALRKALKAGYVRRFSKVVIAAGIPIRSPVMMNTVRVQFLGAIMNRGYSGFGGTCTGRILKVLDPSDTPVLPNGDQDRILLTKDLDDRFLPMIPRVRGVILEGASLVTYETMRILNPGIVFIAVVPGAYDQFEDGLQVSLDGKEKIIYESVIEGD